MGFNRALWACLLGGCIDYTPQAPEAVEYPDEHYLGPLPGPEEFTDRWLWPIYPIDLLFLVDNSGSMDDDQDKLMANIPILTAPLASMGFDYHLGVVTTDCQLLECGAILDWVTPEDAPPDVITDVAQGLIQVGTFGSGTETGIYSLYEALRLHRTDNAGFFREGVPHHVVIISDEPDQTDVLVHLGDTRLYTALDAADEHGGLFVDTIVHKTTDAIPGCIATYAPEYLALTESFPGSSVEICLDDWSPAIAQIASSFVPRTWTFSLAHIPVEGSIEVHIEREDIGEVVIDPSAWVYVPESNAVMMTSDTILSLIDVSEVWITYLAYP